MRLVRALVLFGLVSCATAYGWRAAAEKAMYWIAYLMEEAYDDKSQQSIATGCVGSRVNKRCTFLELCDYLWAPMSGQSEAENKPFMEDVTIDNLVTDVDNPDSADVAEALMFSDEYDPDTGKKTVLNQPKFGYVGQTDSVKLINEADYYKAQVALGDPIRKAKAECAKPEKAELFGKYPAMADESINLAIDFRVQDSAQFWLDDINGYGSKVSGGYKIKTTAYAPLSDGFESLEDNFQIPDKAGTIASWVDGSGGGPALDEATATAKYEKAVADFNAAGSAKEHNQAIDSLRATKRKAGAPNTCT